jgi:hypothetical protein
MDAVIDLAEWRRQRDVPESPQSAGIAQHVDLARLERAVERIHELVVGATDAGGLAPAVETELLAILGELTIDLVGEAAARAERLAARLAAGTSKRANAKTT